ncbi:hypothetical protein [Pseudomonas sp. MF4836]|uniref:hypothetical protein n=1 Tax=Pseudomonas sp. MF4836 TaxID=1960827 RepID=UPI000998213F|nr:hypothetical protein [Pseudomonas sp. MF4836]OOV98436.1 hypothetical protein MF4836_08800 [Pseudomonas sp. MF4836]
MKYGLNLELTYEYKRFSFDSRSSTFEHNETGLTRKVVLDYFGNKLKSYVVKINDTKFMKGASDDFNELFGIFYKEKIGPNEPDRKDFIKKYQLIIDDITIKILSNPLNMNEDFDFDELGEPLVEKINIATTTYNCPACQSGLIRSDCIKDKVYYWKCTDGVKCKAIFSDIKGKPHERLKNDFTNEANTEEPDNLDDLFSGDFDFGSSDESNNEDIPILKDFVNVDTTSTLSKIDDFDDFDFTELDVILPLNETTKGANNKDEFDFSEFDEKEPNNSESNVSSPILSKDEFDTSFDIDFEEDTVNENKSITGRFKPYFHFSNEEYRLYISFSTETFSASGPNSDVVYALQNLATLIFINQEFLTSQSHPEWLYSALEDDLKVIFNNLTTLFKYSTPKLKDNADDYIESSTYLAILNYRNRLGYFKYHKPFVFEHE